MSLRLAWSLLFVSAAAAHAQRVSFGVVGGTNFTGDFPVSRTIYQDPRHPGGLTAFDLFSEGRRLTLGVSAEIEFGKGFSLEGSALRRPLRLQRRYLFPDGSGRDDGSQQIITWQYPILLKYKLPSLGRAQPFLAAGPSFRTRDNPAPSEPSQMGATVGAGVEFRRGRLRFAPTVRYTRWQYDGDYPRIATKRDQIEFAMGVSYATSVPSWRIGNRKLRFGLAAGTPFTKGLVPPGDGRIDELQGYFAGLVAEVELNRSWSIEVDGLYRPFRGDTVMENPFVPGGEFRFELTVLTWQFPALAKYRMLPAARVRPVVEAGPSFRLSGNLNGANPSPVGFTYGAGIETDYKALRISPALRHTPVEAGQEQTRAGDRLESGGDAGYVHILIRRCSRRMKVCRRHVCCGGLS